MNKFLILAAFLIPHFANAAFEENGRRYLSNADIYWSIQSVFEIEGDSICTKASQEIDRAGAPLGENNLLTGEPTAKTPTQSTVQSIANCLDIMWMSTFLIHQDFSTALSFILKLSAVDLAALKKSVSSSNMTLAHLQGFKWSILPLAMQKEVVRKHMENILGSDERILDYGLITDPEGFRRELLNALSKDPDIKMVEAIQRLVRTLILRDEFLSF